MFEISAITGMTGLFLKGYRIKQFSRLEEIFQQNDAMPKKTTRTGWTVQNKLLLSNL